MARTMGGYRSALPLLALILLSLPGKAASLQANPDLRVKSAERELDLNSQLVILSETLEIENSGATAAAGIVLCVSERLAGHRAFFEVSETPAGDAEAGKPLKMSEVAVDGAPAGVRCSAVVLDTPIKANQAVSVDAYSVFTHAMEPRPRTVAQNEVQRMLFDDHLYLVTPYAVAEQSLKVTLASSTVEEYTKVKPTKKDGNTLRYGPYSDVAPWTLAQLRAHFVNNKPFVAVPKLEREIQISQWGNIYVEEAYTMMHGGAKLKGEWSRLDHMYATEGAKQKEGPHIESVTATLPRHAHTLYYRDEIGNVSTSAVRFKRDKVEAIITPRFPLIGGWKTNFVFGYSLPTAPYLKRTASGKLRLHMLFACPIDEAVVDDMTVRVVLPEGASDIESDIPFEDVSASTDTKYTYFDTIGRPVLVIRMRNVVAEHNLVFSVDYSFSSLMMAQEPALLTGAVFLFFALVIAASRMDWTISRDKGWEAAQAKEILTGCMQGVAGVLAERGALMKKLDALSAELSRTRDCEAATAKRAAIERQLKATVDKLKGMAADVEQLSGAEGRKVAEVCELERALDAKVMDLVKRKIDILKSDAGVEDTDTRLSSQEEAVAEHRKLCAAKCKEITDMF